MDLTLMNQIERIDISDIEPNPDNPRKDLGDLTELSDSIRAKGILENLVVMRNPDNFRRVALPDGDSAETWRDATKPKYRAVIGHRRLAAAKLAGLDSVPCVVRDMTRDEAIAAMLAENGQRAALTPYEEALGFQQLSLDMGKSVKQIHDMTGFGETTIRSRLKLAKLDGGKVRAGVERGATLYDFAALDRIESPALKNEVLDKAGTPDFQDALKSAVRKEQRQELLRRWAAEADAFAEPIRVADYVAMELVKNYCAYGGGKLSVEAPEDAGTTKYYYIVDEPYLSLYRDRTGKNNAAKAAWEAAEAARKAREAALGDITERHFTLRKEFVAGFVYKASDNGDAWAATEEWTWRPSIFMPKEAARIFLRVTAVRVERLQGISGADIAREGVGSGAFFDTLTDRAAFRKLWDGLHKPAERSKYGWDANPWVWVISFERCEKPK